MAELAERAGVSVHTVRSIEQGSANTALGNVLNVAIAAGVPLFGTDDPVELVRLRRSGKERLALLPSRTYRPRSPKSDEYGLDF